MADIRDILGATPEMNRSEMKKVSRETGKNGGSRVVGKDKLEISMVGRELLEMKTEASSAENLAKVRESQTIDKARLEQIQSRIEDNFYNNPDIIEKILDELMELDNFYDNKGLVNDND